MSGKRVDALMAEVRALEGALVNDAAIELVACGAHGRGWRARSAITAGATLLRVPLAACLRLDPDARAHGTDALEAMARVLTRERARGDASAHARHLRCLPSPRELCASLLWPPARLARLGAAHAPARAFADRLRAQVLAGGIDLRDFCVCASRMMTFGEQALIVPLADFFNHDERIATACHCFDGAFVTVVAARGYAAGEEVCISYGKGFSVARGLALYGFVPTPSAIDFYTPPAHSFLLAVTDTGVDADLRAALTALTNGSARHALGGLVHALEETLASLPAADGPRSDDDDDDDEEDELVRAAVAAERHATMHALQLARAAFESTEQ